MQVKNGLVATALIAFAGIVTHVTAQGTPQTPPPQTATPQTPAPPGGGRGQGRGGGPAVFPAQQRPPGDPAVIARGKTLYELNCTACHGVDLRGGQLGGPNLLRSQLVLNDQNGELILPVVHGSRADKGMPPIPLPDDDVRAVAEFLHSRTAAAGRQGSPPPTDAPPPNILVGDPVAGQAYFAAKCSSCHSPSGDLQGIATRIPEPKALQNAWVSGGGGRGRGGRGGGGGDGVGMASRRTVTVTVMQSSGEQIQGRLVRIDDFIVTLAQADGTFRSVARDGERPKVEVLDPLEGHRALLAVFTDKDMHDVTAYLVTLK